MRAMALTLRIGRATLGVGSRPRTLIGLARADLRDALRARDFEALRRASFVVEVRDRHARQAAADRALDPAEISFLFGRHQRERRPRHLGARRPADAVDVVLRL